MVEAWKITWEVLTQRHMALLTSQNCHAPLVLLGLLFWQTKLLLVHGSKWPTKWGGGRLLVWGDKLGEPSLKNQMEYVLSLH